MTAAYLFRAYGLYRPAINMQSALAVLCAALLTVFAGFAPVRPAAAQTPTETKLILAFGDSLTAGYGLAPGEGFTDQLEKALRAQGFDVEVANAGVSGDTSSGGRARLDWVLTSLARRPDLAIVELGANDALRGLDPALTRKNIDAIVKALRARGVPTLIAGMLAPPNLGEDYGAEFNGIFADVARQYDVGLYPFFLDGAAADPALNQDDGMHPNKAGVAVIVDRIIPAILPYLKTGGDVKGGGGQDSGG